MLIFYYLFLNALFAHISVQKYKYFFICEKYFFFFFVNVAKMLKLHIKIFSETPIFRHTK